MAATNLNRVIITGNLTRDPELREFLLQNLLDLLRALANIVNIFLTA